MNADESDRERRRVALNAFYEAHEPAGLKSINNWAKRSRVAEATVRQFLSGERKKNMRADTYEKLANGASELLGRKVHVSELIGDEQGGVDGRFSSFLMHLTDDEKSRALQILIAAFGSGTRR